MFRGMNQKQMGQMMKQMGIKMDRVDEVEEVLIKTQTHEYVFKAPEVSIVNAHGQKMYQIVGEPEIKEKGMKILDEDIELVASQAGVSRDDAKNALERYEGNPADAIMYLKDL